MKLMRTAIINSLLIGFVSLASAQADQIYTTQFGLGHTYRVGDHVIAKFGGDYCDATIVSLTSKGLAQVNYESWSRTEIQGDTYLSVGSDIKPFSSVDHYKSGLLFTHSYRVGDRVLAKFGGDPAPATIVTLTSDGRVRVTFDSFSKSEIDGGRYQSVSGLSPVSDGPREAISAKTSKGPAEQQLVLETRIPAHVSGSAGAGQ